MAKPATEARNEAISKGYPIVHKRFNNGLDMKNADGKHFAVYQVGGGWHYGEGLETDTAWVADSDTNYLKMVKAGYNLRARKLFNAGDLVQYIDPVSGQYVKFQPVNFQWIDGTTGSNSLISVAQAVASPSIDDDKLYWPAAFGAGRHFRYTASPTRLIKHIIIDSAANLPACPTWITNPWLELTFTLTPSSGVTMYVDGQAWDQATTKTTANAIEFRLPSGQVVWQLAAPTAYDSSPEGVPCAGQIKLYVNKKIKYAAVRFPKSWIDSAVFPIMLDPTVDYQVGASGDDGYKSSNGSFSNANVSVAWGFYTYIYSTFARFLVDIPPGATIDSAYASFLASASRTIALVDSSIAVEDSADAAQIADYADFGSRDQLSPVEWLPDTWTEGSWYNSPSIVTSIQYLLDTYGLESTHVQIFLNGGASGSRRNYCTYDYSGNVSGPKLHIEYTEASGGDPEGSLVGGKLLRGGLLLHGVLGR